MYPYYLEWPTKKYIVYTRFLYQGTNVHRHVTGHIYNIARGYNCMQAIHRSIELPSDTASSLTNSPRANGFCFNSQNAYRAPCKVDNY